MAVTVSIPKLVSTKLMQILENELVAKKICTAETGSEIKKVGDTVYFPGLAEPTVKAYTGTITYEQLVDASVALLIDQQNYVAFQINDIDAFRSTIDLKGTQTEKSGYLLRNTADAYVFGLYAGANTTVTATITSANTLSTIANIAKILGKANVPAGQRWLAIPEWFKQKMVLAGIKFQVNNGMNGEKGGMEYAEYQGFDIYVSNNVYTTGSLGTENSKILAGSYNSIVYADQIMKSRFIAELEDAFAGGYSSLHVFGAKVLKPAELVLADLTEAAETTI